eukprot:TRINITY_DN11541_c0_g1_i1.p1 TRINITY_DN11541_c0_g1~~TRINITY_DN11541_c0_g1_i1.p1  ORF type:complete len:174 (-),score=25.28 TRINITY_DN11541_c0_g1_i1:314-835(-)
MASDGFSLPFVVLAGFVGFGIGFYSARRRYVLQMGGFDDEILREGEVLEVEKMAQIPQNFKMMLVVRNDLKMGKGKIGAQCGHATLGLYKKLRGRAPTALRLWENSAQVKVATKVESEEEMLELQKQAHAAGLPTHIIVDAGRTQIAPNSKTVMAILGPDERLQAVTGDLKLL